MGLPEILGTYSHVLQTQLITAKEKPRTWFATQDGRQYVIKGPIPDQERKECMRSQRLKEILGIPHTYMREEGEFLIQNCIRDYTQLPTRVQSSRWEKNVPVPVFGAWEWKEEMLENPEKHRILLQSLMEGLLFRKIVGTNDTCSHNFVIWKNIVYSIDDRSLEKRTRYMWKKATVNPIYACLMTQMWPALQATMERWSHLLAASAGAGEAFPFAQRVLDTMKNQKNWRW
jgi:hypothetical protein